MSVNVIKADRIKIESTPFVVAAESAAPANVSASHSSSIPGSSAPSKPELQVVHMMIPLPEDVEEVVQAARAEAEAARAEAEHTIAVAERDAAEIYRTAQSQGFESGRAEGRALGEAEIHEALVAAKRVLEESYYWRNEMLNQSEATLLELVGDIAQKLFGEGFALPPDRVNVMVERAIQQAHELGPTRVRLHPEDAALLNTMWPSGLPVMPDDTIKRGGCIVEASRGSVDSRIEVQLEKIQQTLADEITETT